MRRARDHVGDGYRRLQIKVGGDPAADAERLAAVRDAVGGGVVLFADANGAWTTSAARRFLLATAALDYTLEQPCPTLEECAALRPHCAHPLVLDESIVSLDALVRARRDAGADGVTIKIARVGGVTRAAALRDVAVELGTDRHGRGHRRGYDRHRRHAAPLALDPRAHRAHTVDFTEWVTVANADGLPERVGGRRAAPAAPGLGVTVRAQAARRAVPADAVTDTAPARREPHARRRGRRRGARAGGCGWPTPPGPGSRAAAHVTDELLARGERVYGLTTGVGALKRVSVGRDEQLAFNRLMLLSHRTGTGPDVPEPVGAGGDAGAAGRLRPRSLGRACSSSPTT